MASWNYLLYEVYSKIFKLATSGTSLRNWYFLHVPFHKDQTARHKITHQTVIFTLQGGALHVTNPLSKPRLPPLKRRMPSDRPHLTQISSPNHPNDSHTRRIADLANIVLPHLANWNLVSHSPHYFILLKTRPLAVFKVMVKPASNSGSSRLRSVR
ncbi:hypothetical protein DL98DRAFT_273711 [Cadophora sp. DSE1049]|nr:hypothetical protein DL98DRAFT_273711 [Cadophora sp. DSE1049]